MTAGGWYYLRGSEKHGPVDAFEIERLLRAGEIDHDTLAWQEGLREWARVRDLDAFRSVVAQVPPPLPSASPAAGMAQGTQIEQRRRWVRLWARLIDYCIAAFLLGMATSTLISRVSNTLVYCILVTLVWTPIEAAMLSRWAATPGKLWLRVRVRRAGQPPGFAEALKRSFAVWWSGVAFGSPLFLVAAPIQAYLLTSSGSTTYDREGGFQVRHERVGALRAVIAALVIPFLLFNLFTLRSFLIF